MTESVSTADLTSKWIHLAIFVGFCYLLFMRLGQNKDTAESGSSAPTPESFSVWCVVVDAPQVFFRGDKELCALSVWLTNPQIQWELTALPVEHHICGTVTSICKIHYLPHFFFLVLLVVWLFFLPLDSHLAVCTPDHTVKDLRELHTACQSIFSSMYRGGGKKTGRREGEWRRMAMVVVSMWEEACWPKSLEKQLARWFTKFRTNLISCYQSSRTLCSARLQLCLSFSFFFSPSFFLLNSCS